MIVGIRFGLAGLAAAAAALTTFSANVMVCLTGFTALFTRFRSRRRRRRSTDVVIVVAIAAARFHGRNVIIDVR